ncbi:hypothetical protein [Undibacterium terreum]|uniref:Uncharacterized protein n=1 Tax=Undibacterium terreum TaxID=1224302 RepID=A0A916XPE5_9BURK|nr:hypothetical protein [Undibacterium terreum]GGC88192.1 hypothetical protein GCM10011396_39270 [Undibacterium terreum]
MSSVSDIETDLLAFLLCAIVVSGGVLAVLLFRVKEKRRASRERRRYRREVREERRRAEEDRRQTSEAGGSS